MDHLNLKIEDCMCLGAAEGKVRRNWSFEVNLCVWF